MLVHAVQRRYCVQPRIVYLSSTTICNMTEELLLAADTKSELAKSIPSLEYPASSNRDDMKYVIDGGMLIHRITWKVGSSFTDICASYVSFLSKYPQCTVVFDGNRNSTKDMAHKVRSKNLSCSNITVELSTCLTVKKAQFLSITLETSKDSSTSSLSILFGRVSAA